MINKILSIFFLGFTSGLPYVVVFTTIGLWLATYEVSNTILSIFSSLTIVYAIKVLWAPLVDHASIPILNKFGHRKGWISLMHCFIIVFLISISLIDPQENINLLAFIVILIAISGSFQDIAVDAYRIELADIEDQGLLAGAYQYGYRLAYLFATTFSFLVASRYGWDLVFQFMAVSMLLGFVGISLTKESSTDSHQQLTFVNSIWNPLKDIYTRFGLYASVVLMSIIATYRLTDIVAGSLITPFYYKIGYVLDEIAFAKIIALISSLVGILIGGYIIKVFNR